MNIETSISPSDIEKELQDCVCKCNEKKEGEDCTRQPTDKKPCGICKDLGVRKHACANKCVKEKDIPQVEAEVGWADQDIFGDPITPPDMIPLERGQMRREFRDFMGGSKWPDASRVEKVGEDILPSQFYDFKFKCPGAQYSGPPPWTPPRRKGELNQYDKYYELTAKLRGREHAKKNPPKKLDNTGCSNYIGNP